MSKAGNLERAKRATLPVPAFMVVPVHIPDELLDDYIDHELQRAGLSRIKQFSVRSSADIEDGSERSYAGQFQTYLRVTRSQLATHVRRCRAAAKKLQATHYEQTVSPDLEMTVIIQEMIDAEVSGVVFTANPLGMLNEAVIVVGRGAGTVVGDTVFTNTYYYHLEDECYHVDANDEAPELSEAEVSDVVALARKCMAIFGRYIDLEIAIEDHKVWLLQVRPITTLQTEKVVVFDNHNLVENYPGVSLPLTQSFVAQAYTSIFRRLLERILGSKSVRRYFSTLEGMVRPLNGHMYYQVSGWYAVLLLVPLRNRVIPIWQEMVGVDMSELDSAVEPRMGDRWRMAWAFARLGVGLGRAMRRLHEQFIAIEHDFHAQDLSKKSVRGLLEAFDNVTQAALRDWDYTLANDMYAFVYSGLYRRWSHTKTPLRTASSLPSTQLMEAFSALVVALQESDEREMLLGMSNDRVSQYLQAAASPLSIQLLEYIHEFGDRVPGELKLETATFRSQPKLLIEQLASYTGSKAAATNKPNPRRGLIANFLQAQAAKGIYGREQSRLDRARLFGIVREIMQAIGNRLVLDGHLDKPEDVFYLTLSELRKSSAQTAYRSLVEARRKEYAALAKLPSYSRLVYPQGMIIEKPLLKNVAETQSFDEGTVLQGTPCSPGSVEGVAVVVESLNEQLEVAGKIIIATSTDPGWVFMLNQAKGIIAEKGSMLSHTAIVSRELKIPSIVGVSQATQRIRTGDRISMSGTTGRVEKLS